MMTGIDKFLNTWVSCTQTSGFGTRVGQIDKGFLHFVYSDIVGGYTFVISFNKKDNPSAREGFDDYEHPKGLPCGWCIGHHGTQSFADMKLLTTRINLGEI